MFNEKNASLKISSKLEFLIKTKKIKAQDLSDFLGISRQLVSRNRQMLKSGKLPNSKFLVGISEYFDENFLHS